MSSMSKVVLLTGASGGFGKEIAHVFNQQGFQVIGVSRHCQPSQDLTLAIQADLTQSEERQKVVQTILNQFQRIDILINNAGVGYYEAWEKVNDQDLRKMFDLNFFALVSLTQRCLPELLKNQGSVINISSVAGKLFVPCMGPYCASKAAVRFFSDSLRGELSHRGLHVLDVVVGRINTGFSSRSYGNAFPPETPGGGDPKKLAIKLFHAYRKNQRSLTYPYWYSFIVPLLLGPLRKVYENECRKRWKL